MIPPGSTYPAEGDVVQRMTIIGFDSGLGVYVVEEEDGTRFVLHPEMAEVAMQRPGAVYGPAT